MQKNRKKIIYGQELILDLYDCDLEILKTKEKISDYLIKLCRLIGMKRHGNAIIDRFGAENKVWGEGYSFLQFIETSSITGHFLEPPKSAYINIFSCQRFNSKIAQDFTKKFFRAKKLKSKLLFR